MQSVSVVSIERVKLLTDSVSYDQSAHSRYQRCCASSVHLIAERGYTVRYLHILIFTYVLR
jgi:hypothetical protein